MYHETKKIIKQRARFLRKNQTRAESVFWNRVRNKRLNGLKFLRQHPIVLDVGGKKIFFITDFYCHQHKLIIEIDGGIHEQQKDYDCLRTIALNETGFKVIRFTNDEVVNNLASILDRLLQEIYGNDHAQAVVEYNREVYNKIAKHFSDTRRQVWDTFKPFLQLVKSGDHILDLACGNGRLYQLFDEKAMGGERGTKSVEYTGVDYSEELLEQARGLFPGVKFVLGEMTNIPCADSEFNVVFCLAAFHHLPDKEARLKTLQDIKRVLRPGGKLIMTNWNLYSEWAEKKLAAGKFRYGRDKQEIIAPWQSPDGELIGDRYYYAFTPAELAEMFNKAGFEVEQQYYDRAWWAEDIKDGMNIVSIAVKLGSGDQTNRRPS